MNPGELNCKIDVYSKVEKENSLKEKYFDFEKQKSIWAQVMPQTGNMQRAQAETILTNVTHKIKVHYNSGKGITKSDYIMFGIHRFDIEFILDPYFAHKTLEIFVKEVIE